MAGYIAETYLSRQGCGELDTIEQRVRLAAEALSQSGLPIHYLRYVFIPEDETCLHFFEAVSAEAVGAAGKRAAVDFDRIAEALQ